MTFPLKIEPTLDTYTTEYLSQLGATLELIEQL